MKRSAVTIAVAPLIAQGLKLAFAAVPSDCARCNHKRNPQGGWCYMFRDAPATWCTQYRPDSLNQVGAVKEAS